MTVSDPVGDGVFVEPTDATELSDDQVEAIVGNVDDDAPVVLETAPDHEALQPPGDWQADAHDIEYEEDPDVEISDEDEDDDNDDTIEGEV